MILELDSVHACYGEAHVLHGVSLAVGEGERVALVGRNGVGKTTTVNAVLGLARVLALGDPLADQLSLFPAAPPAAGGSADITFPPATGMSAAPVDTFPLF